MKFNTSPTKVSDIVRTNSKGTLQLAMAQLFEAVSADLGSLHNLLLQRDLPEIGSDKMTLFQQISSRVNRLEVAVQVMEKFQDLSRDVQVKGFRVSVVYPFESDDQSWIILEWREEDGVNALAIFDVNEESDGCSYLVHYVSSVTTSARENGRNRPALIWNVADMPGLKTLFQAALHALGILKMPKSDALNVYCHGTVQSVSTQK